MKTRKAFTLATALAGAVGGCQSADPSASPGAVQLPSAAARAEEVRPLEKGVRAPSTKVRRPDGGTVSMADLYAAKPSILIFYRGGWCPYCTVHLGQIAAAEAELLGMGFQVLAISPDRPEELARSIEQQHLAYQLLSDSDMELCQAFGLAFRVDDQTLEKYRGFGIDLERSSDRGHHLLPVPAVYIVDTRGVIRFAHWNPDYKSRLQPPELLDAARGVAER